MKIVQWLAVFVASGVSLAACGEAPHDAASTAAVKDRSAATAAQTVSAAVALPLVKVHKSPTCGCCAHWVTHLQRAGFTVEVIDTDDLASIKRALRVPSGMASCHTAEVDGYFVEGHVPTSDIERMLKERPDARGLAVPGMPIGSPGMESPDGTVQPFIVHLIASDGTAADYARHGAR